MLISILCTCKYLLVLHQIMSYRLQTSQEHRGDKGAGRNKGETNGITSFATDLQSGEQAECFSRYYKARLSEIK